MPTAEPKAKVGEKFSDRLDDLVDYAKEDDDAICNRGGGKWFRPEGIDNTLTDLKAMSEPFKRTEHEDQFDEATKDADNPGTGGDLAMTLIQGDFLQQLERAFRARHHTSVRARVHAGARRRGHSNEHGVFTGGLKAYVKNIDSLNKSDV